MSNDDLNLFLKSVSFRKDKEGFFIGQGKNNSIGIPFKIAVFNGQIACFRNDVILFQLPMHIGLGAFLVIAQEFGIAHEKFIYDWVDAIEEQFIEEENEKEDEEEKNLRS